MTLHENNYPLCSHIIYRRHLIKYLLSLANVVNVVISSV